MIKKFENVFFDLDGTISDSLQGIQNGIEFALLKAGLHELSTEEIKSMIGIPLLQSLKKYFHEDEIAFNNAVNNFRTYYEAEGIYESVLYPGIFNLLSEASSKYNLYIITAKPTLYAYKLLSHHNAADFFQEIKGCELQSTQFKKSNLMRGLPHLENSIIIGDKPQDILAGKEVGTKTCGVLYGYGTIEEIQESCPDFIIENVNDLHLFLEV